MRTITICALFLLLAACAASTPTLEPPLAGLALVPCQPNLLFFYTDG
jgi:hypothetical protein